MITPEKTRITSLGARLRSPLALSTTMGDGIGNFTPRDARVLYDIDRGTGHPDHPETSSFELAGAREHIHYEPATTRAAIVTCGGLCPGLNTVIRSIVHQLDTYGVRDVLGLRNGYRGLNPAYGLEPVPLTLDMIDDIHRDGGTILGSSRGPQDTAVMVDFLQQQEINILFTIGGDGTLRGADDIHKEVAARGLDIAVIGIPKTIDNDIPYISRSFGYYTALEEARKVLDCAHAEAKGVDGGIGLVKIMGRQSGFIAAGATVASQVVNMTLVPEVPFALEGEGGILPMLRERLKHKRHAVIIVAEGAGQDLMQDAQDLRRDASGNVRFKDIGLFIADQIKAFAQRENVEMNVKYLDPSYAIRSVPANCSDSLLCDSLGRHAVHAAMAGKTDCLIGLLHDAFIHIPISLVAHKKKHLDPEGDLWMRVHETTGQPLQFIAKQGSRLWRENT